MTRTIYEIETDSQIEDSLPRGCQGGAKGMGSGEGWDGRLGLNDAHYSIY